MPPTCYIGEWLIHSTASRNGFTLRETGHVHNSLNFGTLPLFSRHAAGVPRSSLSW